MPLFITIILDGVGIGEQPDASAYGDVGSDTLGHLCTFRTLAIPNLTRFGLGRIRPLDGIESIEESLASFGKMTEISPGKDSTTGHWELAGVELECPFPVYPEGFPADVLDAFVEKTSCSGVLGNRASSGTVIIEELGDEHVATGYPILYTSADSVFQLAAHVDVIPLEQLYQMCRIARDEVCTGEHGVGRVIARPFEGETNFYKRISASRKDFSLLPVALTVQEALLAEGVSTVSIGKINDLFGGVGFSESYKTTSNEQGVQTLIACMRDAVRSYNSAFIWINLVDFDQEFGHRNDPEGFAKALEAFDRSLPSILALMPEDGRLVITADHGNDPTTISTDHSREYVPLLYYGSTLASDLGIRSSFRDHAKTVAEYFGVGFDCGGTSFEHFDRSLN